MAKVVLLFSVIWYAYDSFVWVSNRLAPDVLAYRLFLLAGMAGFLIMALAIPTAFEGSGVAFGVAWLFVLALHAALYIRGTSSAEAGVIRAYVPYNLLAGLLVLAGGIVGGHVQWILMVLASAFLWSYPFVVSYDGLRVAAPHFVERHGLLVILALGESIVVLGAGAGDAKVGIELALIAVLGLALSASLWWTYFGDEQRIEQGMRSAPEAERRRLAVYVYGYLHFLLLFGVVLAAAGLKKAIPDPLGQFSGSTALVLAAGTAVYVAADAGMLRLLGIAGHLVFAVAAVVVFATIPVGTAISAAAQVAVLAAILATAVLVSARAR
jgi:low temperature requirement protein LtrA